MLIHTLQSVYISFQTNATIVLSISSIQFMLPIQLLILNLLVSIPWTCVKALHVSLVSTMHTYTPFTISITTWTLWSLNHINLSYFHSHNQFKNNAGQAMGTVLGRIGVETPKYEVVSKAPDYEIREYQPSVVAEVTYDPSEMKRGRDGGFMILASYIGAVGNPCNIKPESETEVVVTSKKWYHVYIFK